jgi:hypothetical protein
MGQSHRLLSEGMAEPRGLATAVFQADARKTKQWVAALPRANAQATQNSLAQALDSLAGQRLEGSQRLSVLEEIRGAIGESIGLLKGEYLGSALPLDSARAAAAQQVENFHVMLASAYRKAAVEICAPEGNIPMLRGGTVALALARATWHYSQALAVAWRVYRAPEPGVWQGLHRVHRFSVENRLDTRQIPDPIAGSSVELRALYLQAMLMAITHPLAFSQLEQDALWRITTDLAPRSAILRSEPRTNAPAVPEDADRGAGPAVIGETQTQWLDMTPFAAEVDAALARQQEGFSNLVPMRGMGIRVSVEMLQRLKRSFGLAAARSHKRLDATHTLRTVFGLSSLHFYLAGERDFESFIRHVSLNIVHTGDRALWAHASTDASRVPIHEARVLDQSLGGYRMIWEQASQIRARVGELVGLSLADLQEYPEWMLGVIRWLRYEEDGGLSAGVELISRCTSAVGLRVHGRNGVAMEPMRAVEIVALDDSGEINFLVPSNLDSGATRIEVVRDEGNPVTMGAPAVEEILAGVDVMLNAGDYALLRPLRPDPVTADASGVAQ